MSGLPSSQSANASPMAVLTSLMVQNSSVIRSGTLTLAGSVLIDPRMRSTARDKARCVGSGRDIVGRLLNRYGGAWVRIPDAATRWPGRDRGARRGSAHRVGDRPA